MILTGFLGSGKTTLLAGALGQSATSPDGLPFDQPTPPVLVNTALLINEVGAVGVDQRLVGGLATTAPMVIAGGCVCCNVRGDLAAALEDLYWARLERRIPRFERVVIETTGLAHPLPLIETIDGEGIVAERYRLAAVLCTIDAQAGMRQLERHPECRAQAVFADRLLITRTDLAAPGVVEALRERLRSLNATASIGVHFWKMPADSCFFSEEVDFSESSVERSASGMPIRTREGGMVPPLEPAIDGADDAPRIGRPIGPVTTGRALAHAAIDTFIVQIAEGVAAERVMQALEALVAVHGDDILRVKGIIVCDSGPIVFQVAAGVCSSPQPLPVPVPPEAEAASPGSPDADNRLVIITTGIRRSALLATLEAALPGQTSPARRPDAGA